MEPQGDNANNLEKFKNISLAINRKIATLTYIQVAIAILLVVSLAYLGFANLRLSKRIEGVEQFNEKLLNGIENDTKSQIQGLLVQLEKQLKENIDKTSKDLNTTAKDRLNQSLTEISADLSKSANTTLTSIADNLNSSANATLNDISGDIKEALTAITNDSQELNESAKSSLNDMSTDLKKSLDSIVSDSKNSNKLAKVTFSDISADLKKSLDEIVTEHKKAKETAEDALKNIADNLKKVSNRTLNDISTDLKKSLGGILNDYEEVNKSAKAAVQLANSKMLRNEEKAEQALKLAKQIIQSDGDLEKARVYLINAINHNPAKIRYLSELVNLFRSHYKNNHSVLREIRSIAELSLFQLDPSEINEAHEYISELKEAEYEILSSEAPADKTNWLNEFNKLANKDLNIISTDPEKLKKRFEDFSEVLSGIQSGDKYKKSEPLVEDKIKEVQNIYNLSIVAQKITNYIKLLEKEENYKSQTASSRLMAASTSMSVFWQYDLNQLPRKLAKLIQNDLPDKIDKFEKKIKKEKSLSHFKDAKKALMEAQKNEEDSLQKKVDAHKTAIEMAVKLMPKITFQKFRDQISEDIKKSQNTIMSLKKEQYIKYQEWASKVCSWTFRKIESKTPFTDDDAIEIFREYKIASIDLRLVSPEVSQVYHKVLQKIIEELPTDKAFQIHREVVKSKKERMEDF